MAQTRDSIVRTKIESRSRAVDDHVHFLSTQVILKFEFQRVSARVEVIGEGRIFAPDCNASIRSGRMSRRNKRYNGTKVADKVHRSVIRHHCHGDHRQHGYNAKGYLR